MSSTDLKSFVVNNKRFIKIKSGESFRGIYRGYMVGRSRFDPEKEIVSYKFQVPGMAEGKVATWENGSTKVAELMAGVSIGEEVIISREGSTATDTKYTVLPADGIESETEEPSRKKK